MSASKYVNFNQDLTVGGESTSSIFSKLKSLNSTTLLIIGAIILFAVISGVYYVYYVAPQMKAKYIPNHELPSNSDGTNPTAELLFFYAEWCPHCKTAKPIWNELKTEYANKMINGYKIIFTEINCSEETAEVDKMMNQYNVEGYPTIKLLKDGQVIEYDAKPAKDTLIQFLNTVL